jgi:hypothetical protein
MYQSTSFHLQLFDSASLSKFAMNNSNNKPATRRIVSSNSRARQILLSNHSMLNSLVQPNAGGGGGAQQGNIFMSTTRSSDLDSFKKLDSYRSSNYSNGTAATAAAAASTKSVLLRKPFKHHRDEVSKDVATSSSHEFFSLRRPRTPSEARQILLQQQLVSHYNQLNQDAIAESEDLAETNNDVSNEIKLEIWV